MIDARDKSGRVWVKVYHKGHLVDECPLFDALDYPDSYTVKFTQGLSRSVGTIRKYTDGTNMGHSNTTYGNGGIAVW